ncbi:hypothetical protein C1637_08920 [Chryseobacterium lactis]|uniref:DUF4270 domain-containing protein n=1 Tax=Chryseobacterium lactis TaxID=1241981 RepID=A0A3G6RHQ8_CHRLC|nr:DUF4270 family protein [Chryseobacterium lactis]AZA82347.1 DUF4270 domain-containing protein [Chryseobacterium lactis]AZB02729.1 DUF4270 domain-containing protein [Chryseobacterium lactis]PNW13978.1 hypothetical protein C1637_08920 [Chryseobacterium lactis]
MTHTLKRTFAMLLLAIFASTILYNCEPDADALGQQLFDKDAAQGNELPIDVIAYNIDNNDSIRSDASRLFSAVNASNGLVSVGVLGAFNESNFGMQKASYLTQLRMPSDNFDFNGPNAKVDSVVLVVRPPANTADDIYYIADSIKAPGAYDRSDFPVGAEKVAVSIEKKTYPVRKYGNYKTTKSMKINVEEVTTFLDANAENFQRSNVTVSTGALLGSGVFDGTVSTVSVTKKSDNSNVFTGNLGFRINLSNTNFFQTQIIDKKGKPELQDAANFTRYFKGIRISVEPTDGYLFQFSPDDMELIMYYKYDKTDNGVVTHPQTTLKFSLGSPNAHIGQYEYNRNGAPVKDAVSGSNPTSGDPKLYVQGMGGPSIEVKIPDDEIEKLKKKFLDEKIGIIGAKIRLYVDPSSSFYTNTKGVAADRRFTLVPKVTTKDNKTDLTQFTSDALNGFSIYTIGNKDNTDYYDFTITKTLKNIVEGKQDTSNDNKPFVNNPLRISQGSFARNSQGAVVGAKYTTRAIDMNRTVLVGSAGSTNNKRVQLIVTYATKK